MYELPSELSSGGGGEVTKGPRASAGEAASDTVGGADGGGGGGGGGGSGRGGGQGAGRLERDCPRIG